MKNNAFSMSMLFDYYGALLTEKQQRIFDLYYNQDYSLAEIAELDGISRQGVHDTIVRAERTLTDYEQALGCMERDARLHDTVGKLIGIASSLPDSPEREQLLSLLDTLKEQSNGI